MVNQNEVTDELKTVSGTASNPPKPKTEQSEGIYDLGIVAATVVWWLPVLAMIQGNSPENAMLLLTIG